MNSEDELLKAVRLNDSGKYLEAMDIFVKNESLVETPTLISHFALSKVGAAGEGADFDRAQAQCIKSLKSDITNPDIYNNLAKIYILSGKKALAVKAVAKGLKHDSTHAQLTRLRHKLGVRRSPAIGLLPRGAIINKSIGKLTYKAGKTDNDK